MNHLKNTGIGLIVLLGLLLFYGLVVEAYKVMELLADSVDGKAVLCTGGVLVAAWLIGTIWQWLISPSSDVDW